MIYVVGLGPGNPDYILPAARDIIMKADMVIGAARNLKSVSANCRMMMDIKVGFDQVAGYMKDNKETNIAVVVSGDTGFYSMLNFVKRHIGKAYIQVVPGISSLQYMYSRLQMGYENARLVSLHGRSTDITSLIEDRVPMGILTDKEQNNKFVAEALLAAEVEDAVIYVGERLSYPDERITRLTVKESMAFEADVLSVVIVDYEDNH